MNALVVRHNFWWSRTTVNCERCFVLLQLVKKHKLIIWATVVTTQINALQELKNFLHGFIIHVQ